MKNNSKYLWMGIMIVLVIVGFLYYNSFSEREGIESQRLGALITILNEPTYDDTQKMGILSQMRIGDPRYRDIITPYEGVPNPTQQIQDLKALTQRLVQTPIKQ